MFFAAIITDMPPVDACTLRHDSSYRLVPNNSVAGAVQLLLVVFSCWCCSVAYGGVPLLVVLFSEVVSGNQQRGCSQLVRNSCTS